MIPELNSNESQMNAVRELIQRLERLSADSTYAHRASGLRGSLYRALERMENGSASPEGLEDLIHAAFTILVEAAREISAYRNP